MEQRLRLDDAKTHGAPRTNKASHRLRLLVTSLVACVVALFLQAFLMLALVENGPLSKAWDSFALISPPRSAFAAAMQEPQTHDTEVTFGIVISRPVTHIGLWIISDTAKTLTSFNATDATKIDGLLDIGDCVEVRPSESDPTVAEKIIQKHDHHCNNNDDNSDDDHDDKRENDWDDDDHNWRQSEVEGTIVTLPEGLIGEWTIAYGANRTLTFVTDEKTHFHPRGEDALQLFAVGRWVEVNVTRSRGGIYTAKFVRIDDYELGEIVVRLESPAISETIASKYGLVLSSTLLNQANIYLYATNEDDEQKVAERIAKERGVIWAEVNYVNSVPEQEGYKTWGWGGPTEPDAYLGQSAYQQIRLGYTSRSYQGDGIVVAVLDTGIYAPHEQFNGRLRLPSLDVIDDDNDPSEEGGGLAWGHGTHVAGVIAAMAPGATILPVRVLDEHGRGNTFLLAYAIEWAMQQPGVKVINLSLGTEYDSRILRDVIKRATEQGIVVVAAAGNNSSSQIQYPAGYDGVVAVTAVDSNSLKADFANYGRDWVDIAAPGVGIMSTIISSDGPGYATWSGTSMSTAFVSGAAALVAGKWQISAANHNSLLGQLIYTGFVLDGLNPQYAGEIGRLLDVSAALGVDASIVYLPKSVK